MDKIEFSLKSETQIKAFISYMREYYTRFYSDTGIYAEQEIRRRYIEQTEALYSEFISIIVSRISHGIFGEIIENKEDIELSRLVVFVRSYILVVICKKDMSKNIVYIEDIQIRT